MPGAARDEDADRLERLIAAQEAQTNAINRLVQELQDARKKRTTKAVRTRRAPTRTVVVTERAEALARAALARHRDLG
jgi:hypothetical protein